MWPRRTTANKIKVRLTKIVRAPSWQMRLAKQRDLGSQNNPLLRCWTPPPASDDDENAGRLTSLGAE